MDIVEIDPVGCAMKDSNGVWHSAAELLRGKKIRRNLMDGLQEFSVTMLNGIRIGGSVLVENGHVQWYAIECIEVQSNNPTYDATRIVHEQILDAVEAVVCQPKEGGE